jgi:hypothetical protein
MHNDRGNSEADDYILSLLQLAVSDRHWFNLVDSDHSGQLSTEELQKALINGMSVTLSCGNSTHSSRLLEYALTVGSLLA